MEKSSEILSLYLDMLLGGLYLGSVKGCISVVVEDKEVPVISPTPQPMLDIFCNEDSLIFFGFWKHGKEAEYGYVKIPLKRIEVIEEANEELIYSMYFLKKEPKIV